MRNSKLRKLTSIAMLIAIGVILAEIVQFSYPPGSVVFRFSLGYITIILVGLLYGPAYGLVAGVIQDVLGFYVAELLSGVLPWVSSPGAFFIGYTLNAALYGLIPGLLFQKTLKNEDRVFLILSFALSFLMLAGSVWSCFSADWSALTERTVLVILSTALAIVMNVMNLFFLKRPPEKRPPFKLVFGLTILYILTSLILTPIWIIYFYNGSFSSASSYTFLGLWPSRIIKMPIDIALYAGLLPRLYRLGKTFVFGEE